MKLEGLNIVLTGGTSGIGYELVRRLHPRNRLAVIARSEERLAGLAAEFPGILIVRADLADREQVAAAAAEVTAQFGEIDLLINNAAVQYTPTFIDPDFSVETIDREIAVNLTSVCTLTARLLPALRHNRPAAIVNVNSGLALMPKTTSAVYCATKAAVNVFSQSLRHQLEETNVKVLQTFMPLVDTAMTAGRGRDKISARDAAAAMIDGIERDVEDHDIGKVRLLRPMTRFLPSVARRIMKAA